jgi:hypothetical protein
MRFVGLDIDTVDKCIAS